MREFVIVIQHRHAPEIQVTLSGIAAVNVMEAKMQALRYMFAPVWDVIDSAEVP